jgi:hypothetical protein
VTGRDGIEAGAVGACAACAVHLGADPITAPLIAAIVGAAVRLTIGLVHRAATNRKKGKKDAGQ